MAEDAHPAYLSPSELGSKDYQLIPEKANPHPFSFFSSWETYYARTRAHISPSTPQAPAPTHDSDPDSDSDLNAEDDPGTSWFAEHNAPQKVLRFLTRAAFPLAPRNTRGRAPAVLDLGTGNGSMLALLRKKGRFAGPLVGVDYSAQSVELARELQASRGHAAYRTDDESESESEGEQDGGDLEPGIEEQESSAPIRFEEWDILGSQAVLSETGEAVVPVAGEETLAWFPYGAGGFDIVLDKGTFDAISLADDAQTTRVCERYPDIARRLVRRGGFLIVTSCNWTEEELVRWFTGGKEESQDRFAVWGRVEYPRFRFGGQEGQGVCTVCFERVGGTQ
ncbi:hypothetical protein N7462_002525 [Penicillium macrosclerotiorum]|uniref:uncharacterized protein n=1 Tax=Penicillium macrosclerotiorum TaxID=303699 RepID=UPI00254999CA|nr:uncharacterized protein N7462_002525 [Penicillium macrosclerotiorum]KAJ5693102.1 hypothetical protein N7462_002525 [Penicillium macrosclerotiorum]